MKRLIVGCLCCMLAVSPALAERLVTPTPPPEEMVLEIPVMQEWKISDVLSRWSAQEANQEAFAQLEALHQDKAGPISQESLLRILMTYCIEMNPDTTCQIMADYEPLISVEGSEVYVTMMTHARGFTIAIDAYTGDCLRLTVDEDGSGNG